MGKSYRTATLDVPVLGQVFTPSWVVDRMLGLRQNTGTVLEPSAGDGAFLGRLGQGAVGLEIDSRHAPDQAIICDFFDYPTTNRFDTVIGNPPYVRHQDITPGTRRKLGRYQNQMDGRTNLYLLFVLKAIDHLNPGGELIFITPRDFLKSTSARPINQLLYDTGSFTHFEELGDRKVFEGATPNCAIWRWEKNRAAKQMNCGRTFMFRDGQIWFGEPSGARLGDFFDVKVGAASGADRIFSDQQHGNVDFVCSKTRSTGYLRRMIYDTCDPALLPHKQVLMARKIRQFDESNWWEWGRKFCHRPGPRIYVNTKTRHASPFFVSETEAYDASVLALFPKTQPPDIDEAAERLNSTDWNDLGFVCDGRHIFGQRSLSNAPVGLKV